MDPKQMTRRILDELAAERASHGHGAAEQIDRRMSKSKGYLSRIIRGDLGLHVETLFEALEALEVDAADFFARVTGARVCPDRLLRRLERQASKGGPSVLDRFEIVVGPRRVEVTAELERPPRFPDLAKSLGRLDEELFSYPGRALRSAQRLLLAAVHRLARDSAQRNVELVCRALGGLAAAYRVHAELGLAARCLRLGFQLCEAMDLPAARADLLQRIGYLVGDHGEYELAVELSRQASDQYLMLQDEGGIGRALVDRAIFLRRAGQQRAALQSYLTSLRYFDRDARTAPLAWHNRYSALQGLGSIYCQLGRLDRARDYARRAAETHETKEGQNWWRLAWLRGEIALRDGDAEDAKRWLVKARDGFSEIGNVFDVAVVSLRLARAVLCSGRMQDMQKIAADMMRLLEPLDQHKIARASIYEFSRAALAGEVTTGLVNRLVVEIQKDAPDTGASEFL